MNSVLNLHLQTHMARPPRWWQPVEIEGSQVDIPLLLQRAHKMHPIGCNQTNNVTVATSNGLAHKLKQLFGLQEDVMNNPAT